MNDEKTGLTADSYLHRVRTFQERYPVFKSLDDFASLQVGSPKPSLTVLEFRSSGVTDISLSHPEELTQYLSCPSQKDSTCRGRLYILEDPSLAFIESLGKHLDPDPSVFASYIYTPDWSRPKEYRVTRQLPSRQKQTPTYTLKYQEVRELDSDAPTVQNYRVVAPGNVPRNITTFTHGTSVTETGNITSLVRRNVSFWYRMGENGESWDGNW
jgi:hypothetical protein